MPADLYAYVTGASGFIGQKLVEALSSRGIAGIAISRRAIDPLPRGWSWRSRAEMLSASLLPAPTTSACMLHLEVKQHVPKPAAADEAEFQAINVDATQCWLDRCAENSINRFVYFSSIKAVEPIQSGATDELAAGALRSPYGRSKWEAEKRVRRWTAEDPRRSALILRPAVVYGPGNVANVAAMMAGIRRNRFFLVGANENVKSMIAVKNATAAVVHLLERMQLGACEVYNLVDQESHTVREIDAMIRARIGKSANSPTLPLPIARTAAVLGDAFGWMTGRMFPINSPRLEALLEHTHFSCQKLLDSGFRHQQTIEEGLSEMIEWNQQHD